MNECKEFEQLNDQLLFDQAKAFFNTHAATLEEENAWQTAFETSRMERGLYQYARAYAAARKALDLSQNIGQAQKSILQMANLCFLKGINKRGYSLLNDMGECASPALAIQKNVMMASASYESGDLVQATALLNQAEGLVTQLMDVKEGISLMDQRLCCELYSLMGDVLSSTYESNQFSQAYQKALGYAYATPENWRSLRIALLLHNLADGYEGLDLMNTASAYYASMEDEVKKWERFNEEHPDLCVSDASSYQLEFLFSLANFEANQGNLTKALALLKDARKILDEHPPVLCRFYESRYGYYHGLFELYRLEENPDDVILRNQIVQELDKTLTLQKELIEQRLDKPDHYGKSAYYLSFLLNGNNPKEKEKKLALMKEAEDIFLAIYQKDPLFYQGALAEFSYTRGFMALEEDPGQALTDFLLARDRFEKLCKEYPEDETCALSLISASSMVLLLEEEKGQSKATLQALMQNLLDQMHHFAQSFPEGFLALEENIGYLLEQQDFIEHYPDFEKELVDLVLTLKNPEPEVLN